jgi:hypothetical protein
MSNIKWKFESSDVTFISPADRFDDHVRKFAAKFGYNKHKLIILENGNDSTNNPAESSPSTDPWESAVPKSTRTRTSKQTPSELPNLSGAVDESDSTSDTLANPDSDSSDSESLNSNVD